MEHLFYILGAFFLIHEINIFQDPKAYYEKLQKFKKIGEIKKSEDKFEVDRFILENNLITSMLFHLFYLAWTIIGCLFASQWILFVSLFIFGIFSAFYRKRFYENNARKNAAFLRFDAIVSMVIIGILILNHFHHIL